MVASGDCQGSLIRLPDRNFPDYGMPDVYSSVLYPNVPFQLTVLLFISLYYVSNLPDRRSGECLGVRGIKLNAWILVNRYAGYYLGSYSDDLIHNVAASNK
ncbi:hypothetical protein TNCV_4084621 [Trichonephila clavipes]|nr:hypothetical protein TNCV_4084621 [Trichonephila clavipes]